MEAVRIAPAYDKMGMYYGLVTMFEDIGYALGVGKAAVKLLVPSEVDHYK
jgi:hypothetical protein